MVRSAKPTVWGGYSGIGVRFSAWLSLLSRTWLHAMRELRIGALCILAILVAQQFLTSGCTQTHIVPAKYRSESVGFRVRNLGFGVWS